MIHHVTVLCAFLVVGMRGIPVSEKYRGIEGDDGIVYRGRRGFTTGMRSPHFLWDSDCDSGLKSDTDC